MARSQIRNLSPGPIALPLPFRGVLDPGKRVITSKTLAELATIFNCAERGTRRLRFKALADSAVVTTGLEPATSLGDPAFAAPDTNDFPGTDPTGHADAIARIADRSAVELLSWPKVAADAAAADATAEVIVHRVRKAGTLATLAYEPASGGVVASDTHYATLTVRKRDGAGGNAAVIATLVTNLAGGNWTQWVHKAFASLANTALVAGDLITLQIEKAGDGVAIPSGLLHGTITPASGA